MWPFGKNNNPKRIEDKVWTSNSRRNDGLIADAKNYMANGKLVFISYFFQSTYELISQMLEKENIAFEKIQTAGSASQLKVNCVSANQFLSQSFIDKLSFESHEIIILFAEHYPLYKAEKESLDALIPIGTKASYGFYVSLDERLMEIFGGDRIKDLLAKMGLKEDDFISHSMVTSAIENAQKKLEGKIGAEMKANSMADWFNKNYQT